MECTVPVEVHLATEHADVGSLERTISAALVEVGVKLWRELVGQLELALPIPERCAGCGGRLKANGRAPGAWSPSRARSSCAVGGIAAPPAEASTSRSTPPSASSPGSSTPSASASAASGW